MLTIVIPTKNNQDLLIQNLQQNFLGRLPESVHVLIHDNSEKESDLIQRTLKGEKQFTYIHEQKSLSVGENFHQSTKFVFTEYFCFLGDDDFIIFKDWHRVAKCLETGMFDNINFPIYSLFFWKGSHCKYLTGLEHSSIFISMGPLLQYFYSALLIVINFLTKSDVIALTMPDLARLPKAYYGIVHTHFYRANFNEILGSPDSFIAGKLRENIILKRSKILGVNFFVPGTSKGSTAGLSNKRSHDGKISEQLHFSKVEKEKLSEFDLDLFLPEIIWAISFLMSQRKPLTVLHRQVLYFYVLFKYRKNLWATFFPKSLSLNFFVPRLFVAFTIAVYCYLINRACVASVVTCRYFLAKRVNL